MGRLRVLETHLQYLENATNTDDILFPPSSIGPVTYWTSQDKALFFKSIARHSRWRPDLIAEDLGGTKTVGDIWSYIKLLNEGSVMHPPIPSSDPPLSAREMSEKWVANEEELAKEIISNEEKWMHHINLKARRNRLHVLRESLALEEETPLDPLHDPKSFDDQKKSLERIWRKEDIMSKLDLSLLRRMDRLSRGRGGARRSQTEPKSRTSTSEKEVIPLKYQAISIPDLSSLNLTPLERKRLRERLWHRQKLAIKKGLSPSTASTYLGKLKNGRKPQNPKSDSQIQETNQEKNPMISVKQASVEDARLNDGGSSKINRDPVLESYDITKDSLLKDGLDIFRLENFAILPRLFGHVFGSESFELGDQHLIAYDVLCYLRTSLVQFLAAVIGMAITHRSTSIRQRRADEFTPDVDIKMENILASLLSLGQSVDRDHLFERMYAILQSRQDDGAASDLERLNLSLNPVKTPFLNELSLPANPLITDLTSCVPILSDQDILIGEDIDEEILLQDLASEEALEQMYILTDQKYEKQLWMGEGEEDEDEDEMEDEDEDEMEVN